MAPGNTRDQMVSDITYELGARTDLNANGTILRYINNAIERYQKERFRFNELTPRTPFTINTVQGKSYYDGADDARIPRLFDIDYINYVLGTTVEKMLRVTPEDVYLALQTGQEAGPPQTWAWDGDSIVIYPTPPAQVYTLTIGGYLQYAGPATGSETDNVWMNAAERLIRSRAKYDISVQVTRNEKMAQLMSPIMPQAGVETGHETYWAYCELKSEANKIRGTSRVRAMRF
jgi:hypothetical protein